MVRAFLHYTHRAAAARALGIPIELADFRTATLNMLGVPVGDQPYGQHHFPAKSDKVKVASAPPYPSSTEEAILLRFIDTAAIGALLYYTHRAAAARALGIPIELADFRTATHPGAGGGAHRRRATSERF